MGRQAITSKRVVTPQGIRPAVLVMENGRIAAIDETVPAGASCADYGDLVIMPGVIDAHVHINEPGRTAWEGFQTATHAAAAGGVTTVVDMPLNSSPVTVSVDAFRQKLEAARGKLWVDCGFYGGIIPGNTAELEGLIAAGVLGMKAFMVHSGIDEFPNATEADLRAACPILKKHRVPLLAHAELDLGSAPRPPYRSYRDYLASRPDEMEQRAIEVLISLCREYRTPIHVVHLATASALGILRAARGDGLPLTVESCPHYLYFSVDELRDGDSRYKCAPPIRDANNRDRLWKEGLQAGIIDLIASDHSPAEPQIKAIRDGDLSTAWGGIAGLQFTLPVVWNEATRRGVGIEQVSRWLSSAPAALLGLSGRKGSLQVGADADVVVWSPEERVRITPENIQHRHKITPYEGRELLGAVKTTYVRGQMVFEQGWFSQEPLGNVVLRHT